MVRFVSPVVIVCLHLLLGGVWACSEKSAGTAIGDFDREPPECADTAPCGPDERRLFDELGCPVCVPTGTDTDTGDIDTAEPDADDDPVETIDDDEAPGETDADDAGDTDDAESCAGCVPTVCAPGFTRSPGPCGACEPCNVPVPPPAFAVNEMSCAGADFVELFNPGASEIDIGGWQISDTVERPPAERFVIPPGTKLAPGAFAAFGETSPGWRVGFRCGEEAAIVFDPSGAERFGEPFPPLTDGTTWGRLPDGTGAFGLTLPTPGARNTAAGDTDLIDAEADGPVDAVDPDAGPVVVDINEVSCEGVDYVELISKSTTAVDLGGWRFTDDANRPFAEWFRIPAGTFLATGARRVFSEADAPFGFGIACGRDALYLANPSGVIVAQAVPPPLPAGVTWGRIPDGTGPFTYNTPTPGATNVAFAGDLDAEPDADEDVRDPDYTAPAVAVNEISCEGIDFIEFTVTGTTAIDIGGMSISDDINRPRSEWLRIPFGTRVTPGGFAVVREDRTPFPFAFNCGAESVFVADGTGVVFAEVPLPVVAAGTTWGRLPDGTGAFVTTLPTPGAPNTAPDDADDAEIADLQPFRPRPSIVCGAAADCLAGEVCAFGQCRTADGPPLWSLTIDPDDWQLMQNDRFSDVFYACKLEAGGVTYERGCAVRVRGGTSREYPKFPLQIEFPEGVPHPGLSRRIILRSEYNDPSFVRAHLAQALFRTATNVPVSMDRYVNLNINGARWGVMREVERVDGAFLRRNGLDAARSLYESDPPLETGRYGAGALVPLPTPRAYEDSYQKRTGDNSYADLIDLIENRLVADFNASAPPVFNARNVRAEFNVTNLVQYFSLLGLVGARDNVRKNFAFTRQHPPGTDHPRWFMLPWDLDLSFGCNWTEQYDTRCVLLQSDTVIDAGAFDPRLDYLSYPTDGFYNLLNGLVFGDAELNAAVVARICEMYRSALWRTELPAYKADLVAWLRASVEADPMDVNADLAAFDTAHGQIDRFFTERTAFLTGGVCNAP